MVAGGKDLYQNVAKLVEQNAKLLEKIDIKDKTVAMSGASQGKKETVLEHFGIILSGAVRGMLGGSAEDQ
jgi:hypothetical protein